MKRFMQFFAPNDDASAAVAASQAPIEVPESASVAADYKVEDVNLAPDAGVIGPKEAMGDDGTDEMERMEANMEGRPVRERDPATGKFLPKGQKTEEKNLVPKKEEKPVAKPAAKKPAPKPVETKPEPAKEPAKIKIGDQEKTAEEWAKEFSDAQEKLKAAEAVSKGQQQPPEKKEQVTERKPEEIEAERAAKVTDFLSKASKQYEMKPEELDDILAGGPKAVTAFATSLAKVEANTRQWAVEEFNQVLKKMWDKMDPLLKRDSALSEYQREHSFLTDNPEIKDNPKGYETYQTVRKEMQDGEIRIREQIKNGTVSEQDKRWLEWHDTFTPEQVMESIARITKERLAGLPKSEEPKPEPQKIQKTPAASKPFNGDRPGGSQSAPSTESPQARQLREMTEAGY